MNNYQTLERRLATLEANAANNRNLILDLFEENKRLTAEVGEFQDAKRSLFDLINATEDLFTILTGEGTGDIASILESYRESQDLVYEAMFKEDVGLDQWQREQYRGG